MRCAEGPFEQVLRCCDLRPKDRSTSVKRRPESRKALLVRTESAKLRPKQRSTQRLFDVCSTPFSLQPLKHLLSHQDEAWHSGFFLSKGLEPPCPCLESFRSFVLQSARSTSRSMVVRFSTAITFHRRDVCFPPFLHNKFDSW